MKKLVVLLRHTFFPYSRISQVPIEHIRKALLLVFQKWGLPKVIKTDNGAPFGVPTRDAVPIMSLWLKGWGIEPVLNRPKQPQDNASVERTQGTTSRWAEISKALDVTDLQNRLDRIRIEHLEKYQVKRLGFATRKSVFPDLYLKPREWCESQFDIQAAYAFLSRKTLQRKVALGGTISLYGKTFQVHVKFKRQLVAIKFNNIHLRWDVFDLKGELIKIIEDARFDKDNIILLTACQ